MDWTNEFSVAHRWALYQPSVSLEVYFGLEPEQPGEQVKVAIHIITTEGLAFDRR